MHRTKIISTIGPASNTIGVLRKMLFAGMRVARLNFSHSSHREHKHAISLIRQLNREYGRHIRILQDLEGYRIRLGRLRHKNGMQLKKQQALYLSNKQEAAAEKNIIAFGYPGPLTDIKVGALIYVDDGNIALLVKQRTKDRLKTEVVIPGLLKENKGVNIPALNFRFRGLTDKDELDIQFGITQRVDFIAQSFVRDKSDILPIKELIKDSLPDCKLIAKIENRQGIKNIDGIIKACDGIMIARGDMGVSIPLYEIPVVQKEIIKKCNQAKKFVITATQMLESMTKNIRPERAEVTDVANAVLDGSDFLMLSAETAVGRYPAQTVKMMSEIIGFTEKWSARKSI